MKKSNKNGVIFKVWVVKKPLDNGILEVNAILDEDGMITYGQGEVASPGEWFHTPGRALARAEEMRQVIISKMKEELMKVETRVVEIVKR
jgi:hypothetical protein